ncbi:MAG: pyruvate kinase, partial [Myxococcota bacterium]|nr:pyruvate kinase [Myxococcota bacterium]
MIIRRAKIVCTIGPAVESREGIRGLIEAGMDVARLNFSHGSHAEHGARLDLVRSESEALGKPVAILQDLCGPKIRTGTVGPSVLETGQMVDLIAGNKGDERTVAVEYATLAQDVRPDDRILLSDGQVELRVLDVKGDRVQVRVEHGGPMRSKMGVNLPSGALRMAALTEKDKVDLEFGLSKGVDYVALSFVRRAEEVHELRQLCEKKGRPTPIIAKIETPSAVERLDAIVRAADGAMVARGDLGVELPPETVPVIQKQIIGTCRIHRKPVIVATEMLQSMVDSPRPTRAEASDVAHAVFGGTDAVMLSAETATGKHPHAACSMMDRIIRQAEASRFFQPVSTEPDHSTPDSIAHAAVAIAREVGAKLVVALTETGVTARLVSKARANAPIVAFSSDQRTLRQLALLWGVAPRSLMSPQASFEEQVRDTTQFLTQNGLVKSGERYVMV